jgi:hypothetical protein
MVFTLDLTTLILLIAVNGGVDCGAVAYVSGWWSKRKLKAFLESEESDPYVERLKAKFEVPTVAEVRDAVIQALPHIPTTEELRASLPELPHIPTPQEIIEQMPEPPSPTQIADELRPHIVLMIEQGASKQQDVLLDKMQTRLNALEASRTASFDAMLQRVQRDPAIMGSAFGGNPQVMALVQILRAFHKKKEAEMVLALSGAFSAMRGLPGGGNHAYGQPQQQPFNPYAIGPPPQQYTAPAPAYAPPPSTGGLPPISGAVEVTPDMVIAGPPGAQPARKENPASDGVEE